jgi:uncharacterized MnhB-related membrane protein
MRLSQPRLGAARVCALVTVLLALATFALVTAPDVALAAGSSQAALATRLARSVSLARNERSEHRAVLAILRALHLRVASDRGSPLSPGGRSLPHTFTLYDFEVRSIAQDLLRRRLETVGEFANQLAAISQQKTPPPPLTVLHAIEGGVRESQQLATNPRALLLLSFVSSA